MSAFKPFIKNTHPRIAEILQQNTAEFLNNNTINYSNLAADEFLYRKTSDSKYSLLFSVLGLFISFFQQVHATPFFRCTKIFTWY